MRKKMSVLWTDYRWILCFNQANTWCQELANNCAYCLPIASACTVGGKEETIMLGRKDDARPYGLATGESQEGQGKAILTQICFDAFGVQLQSVIIFRRPQATTSYPCFNDDFLLLSIFHLSHSLVYSSQVMLHLPMFCLHWLATQLGFLLRLTWCITALMQQSRPSLFFSLKFTQHWCTPCLLLITFVRWVSK